MIIPGKVIWWILLVVFLLIFGIAILSQFKDLLAKGETKFSPLNQSEVSSNTEQEIGTITYRGLDIDSTDPPDTAIYKLFRNFDPLFLNETKGNKIFYGSFILDLKGNTYNIYSSNLINMLREGIKDFSNYDPDYQIGENWQQPPNCGAITANSQINYNNGCWVSALDARPNPCKIYVNSTTSNFDGKVKIKVVWYVVRVSSKTIIDTIVTLCDG